MDATKDIISFLIYLLRVIVNKYYHLSVISKILTLALFNPIRP